MATTFHPNKSVNTKPLHSGAVIYADNTCIRTVSSEQLGGGGMEVAGALLITIWSMIFAVAFLSGTTVENPVLISSWWLGISILFIILPIILFRYKPNYLVFSRKSQEIYYVKSPKLIVKMKWKDVVGEYRKVTIFTGSGIAQIDTLRLNGTTQYGEGNPTPASLPFIVDGEENASQLWSYIQAYMKDGPEGLEPPSYDRVKEGFWDEVKRVTKLWLYDEPLNFLFSVFSPRSPLNIIYRILLLPFAVFFFPFHLIFTWPGSLATALVESTRKRAPFPEDLLPYITDNPESYGKENSS